MKCFLMDVQQIYVFYGYIELFVVKIKNNDVGYYLVIVGYFFSFIDILVMWVNLVIYLFL